MKHRRALALLVVLALAAAGALFYVVRVRRQPPPPPVASADESIAVEAFYGRYDARTKDVGMPARSLRGPHAELWRWAVKPSLGRRYRIGVLFPNREENDPYWKSVRRGIAQQARLSGIEYTLLSSDDYSHAEQHQQQFETLARSGVDAIVLGAIHYRAMDSAVERATSGAYGKKIPVIAVVNDVYAPAISGKVLVSFLDMGRFAGRYVFDEARAAQNSELSIAFFPGPINSGWAPDSLRGFLSVIRDYPGELRILNPQWGSPDDKTQAELIETTLEQNPSIDYIVGNAVAARAAVRVLKAAGRDEEVRVVSTYYSDALGADMATGRIEAAPWDHTDALGRIAVGMAIRILNGEKPGTTLPFQVGPSIEIRANRLSSPAESTN